VKRVFFALALLFASPAFAQTTEPATNAEIESFLRLHNRALLEMKSLVPIVNWPTNRDPDAFLSACSKARVGVDASLPRAQSIVDELLRAKPLGTTGDVERDHAFQTTHVETINAIGYLQTALTQVSSLCAAAEQGDKDKAFGAATAIIDAVIKTQEIGSIAIRAGKGDPGPPAYKAAIEGLALSVDGLGIIARYMSGRIQSEEAATRFANLAPQLRTQANLIRAGYADRPTSAGAAYGEKLAAARASLPEKLEEAAALFENTSSKLAAGSFNAADYSAYLKTVQTIGIGNAYDKAWGLQ
jgi:hypothetical protein